MKDWEDLVYDTAERFGGSMPHPETAKAVADVYNRAPHAVLKAIDRIHAEYEQGGVRSPWGALKHRVGLIKVSSETVKTANQVDATLERAEQWIRNAGLMYDRENEVLDELFGQQGMLRKHDTPDARLRILLLWRELRPLGETTELEAEARGHRYQQQRKELACRASRPTSEPDSTTPTKPTSAAQPATTNT